MTIYSKRLVSNYRATANGAIIYTAPALGIIVVRDICLHHASSTPTWLGVYSQSGGEIGHIAMKDNIAQYETFHWEGRQVLNPGENLCIACAYAGYVFYRISGYLLGT